MSAEHDPRERTAAADGSGSGVEGIAARCLRGVEEPTIAILARRSQPRAGQVLAERFPGSRISVHEVQQGLSALHLSLAVGGPFDLILDLAGGPGSLRRFKNLIFHATTGGAYVVRLPGGQGPQAPLRRRLVAFAEQLAAAQTGGVRPPQRFVDERVARQRDFDALAFSLRELSVEGRFLVAVNGVRTLAKIPEQTMNRFMSERDAGDRLLTSVPARTWDSRCTVRASSQDRLADLPRTYEAPLLSLRACPDVTCLPRQIAFRSNAVLPASFPSNARDRLRNTALSEWAPWFVGEPDVVAARLPGTWFYLDNVMSGHFGHAMSEQVSHLWGWRPAKDRYPDLRALVFPRQGKAMAAWEYELLEAGGINREDIVEAEGPVTVDTLVMASPAYSRPTFVHPIIAGTYDQIGATLAARAGDRAWPDRVFFSRRGPKRWCHNTAEVEEWHQRAGFEVVFPEDHSLPDQVQYVRHAQVVAGFAGSGMFHIALAGGPRHVIVIGSESYPAHNEYMMSSVLGHRLDLVLCRPDVPRAGGRFSRASFHSDFTFDPDREGVFLRSVLDDL